MTYYIILRNGDDKQYLSWYGDAFHKAILTKVPANRMEYLSKDALIDDLKEILVDKQIISKYTIEIGVN